MTDLYVVTRDPGSLVVLGGRSFHVIDFDRRIVLQDHYLMALIAAIGADKVMPMDGEGDVEWVVRLQARITDSGRAHELIAGYLLPEGVTQTDWTRESAKEVAKHIGKCNTDEDRALVHQLAIEVALGFFVHGLALWKRSQRLLESAPDATNGAALH